jgi:glycosyltransferase involved in cell wall biosynthesis
MPKILQVSTRHNVGGISKLIIELLGDPNFDQVYATGSCEKNEMEYSLNLPATARNKFAFIRIQKLGRSINLARDFLALVELIKILRLEKPDIVHTHMSKAGLLGRLAALISSPKTKRVHSFHGHVLDGYFNKFFASVIVKLEIILGRFTDGFVFDGNQTMVEINSYGIKPRKIQRVILPGLIKSVSKKGIEVSEKKLQILVVARIEKIKRIDLVLSVARVLTRTYPALNYEITIVGDGGLREVFENQSGDESLPIKFVGWKDNVSEYYQKADLLLSTSDSEGTPLTFMEAASFGCPIISTKAGSVADLISHRITGILCESNPEIIAEEIVNLWKNKPLLREYSQNSLIKAADEFTVNKFINKHSDLYFSLLA